MLALVWNNEKGHADLAVAGGRLMTDPGIETLILILLFTDKRDDVDKSGDPRGWWATKLVSPENMEWGSKIWVARRGNVTRETAEKIRREAKDALQPLVAWGYVAEADAKAEFNDENRLVLTVVLTKPGGEPQTHQFQNFGENL
jgi:phage gp46-like protein